MLNNIYYVYELIDPRDKQPFYVGYGHGARMYAHIYEAKKSKHNNMKLSKIRKILVSGYDTIIYKKVIENVSALEAKQKEIQLIRQYGRLDLGTGILCNHTDGGDGIINLSDETKRKKNFKLSQYTRTEETKHKISLANIKEKNPFYNKHHTEEAKQKMKENNNSNSGSDHHNYKVTLHDQLIKKYGIDIGEKKYQEYCENQSKYIKQYYNGMKERGIKRKSAYEIWLEKYGKEEADRRLQETVEKNLVTKKLNNKPKISNYQSHVLKYGKEEADRLEQERRTKIQDKTKGRKSNFQLDVEKYGLEAALLKKQKTIDKIKATKNAI